ncbi:MAG: DUF4349 domain-containing protein [Treponema sp.]|jgi:hypothetical protein|nr:DUF4349 domain-containing protein [Treponema sp.]
MKANIILITFITVVIISGCSRGYNENQLNAYNGGALASAVFSAADGFNDSSAQMMRTKESSESMDVNLYGQDNESSEFAAINEIERKLIKRANVRMRVDNLETADLSVAGLLKKYNGYTAFTETDEYSRYYTLRIPVNLYDIFLSELNGIGRLIRSSENTEDVTNRYYDLEGQLESKRELLKTFQSYLERARTMEEILAVEYRIADLQREIEFTGTQLRNLSNRIDYATIDLYLQGPAGTNREESFGDQIKNLFDRFNGFLSSVAIFLLGLIIYGIPVLLILILLVWILFGRIGLIKKLWKFIMVKTTKDQS